MYIRLLIILAAVSVLTSCSKEIDSRDIEFDVLTYSNSEEQTNTFKVNDTVNFVFKGNPDRISFYSGEIGYRYDYRKKVSDTSSNVTFSFTTARNTTGASGNLSLLVSTNYAGYRQNNKVDSLNVLNSTWSDISDRALFANNATSRSSGNVNLSDYAKAGKPIYLAFKYAATAASTQSRWTISNISLRHTISDTSYVIGTAAVEIPSSFPAFSVSPGWGSVFITNPAIKYNPIVSTATTTSFGITGSSNATNAVATESWLIAGPFDLSRVLPDSGIPVKSMDSNAETSSYASENAFTARFANYSYKFTKKGVYQVAFFASNSTRDNENSIVKRLTITVN